MERKKEIAYGVFDWSEPSLIKFVISNINADVDTMKEYVACMAEVIDEVEGPFVYIADATKAKWISGEARIEMGRGIKDIEAKYKDRLKKTFMVVPNAITKMMLKGLNVIYKPNVPQVVHSKMDVALEEARKEIASWQIH